LPDVVDDAGTVEAQITETPEVVPATANLLLHGRVSRALLWLALPVLAEQFLNLFVGLVDTYLAGTVSKEATAAIGLATQVVWLVSLLFSFVGAGATALVSRHTGMGATAEANHFSNQALLVAVVMGLAESALIWLGAPVLPWLLGWHPEPAGIAIEYLRIDSWGYVFYSVLVIAGACWRGTGDTRTPLYVMCVVNAVNMIVSAALRFGWGPIPSFGVTGIVMGTVTCRVLGGLIVLGLLLSGRSGIRMRRREMRVHRPSIERLLRVGIPAGADGVLLWVGQFAFLMIISRLATGGDQAAIVAAHYVGIRVEALSYLPALAWAIAAATLVGQSLGAGQPRRASRSGHLAALQSSALCAAMGVLYFVFAPQIYALFNASEDLARVSEIGVPALRMLAFFQIPLAMMIVYTNALRGAGDTRYPLLFTLVGTITIRLPLAYVGGIVLDGGLIGAWTGMFVDMVARAAFSYVRFARGKWQQIQV